MARTIETIQQEMLTNLRSNDNLAGLNSPSKFAIFRLFTYTVAVSIWALEKMFDIHTAEINEVLLKQKSGRKPWYRTMALQFQFGFALIADTDYFNNTGIEQEVIDASKIIKYAAVVEADDSSRVILKIAGETGDTLSPITAEQLEAFTEYIQDIRWAGVTVDVINYLPDRLFLNIQIKRDALVLDSTGISILNGNNPVNDALKEFMKQLPFDGELKLSALVDKLQVIPGILDCTVLSAQSSWIDPLISGYGVPQPIFIAKTPVSGYFEIVNFDNISYVV